MTEIYWKTRDHKVINALCNNLDIPFHLSINRTTAVDLTMMDNTRRECLRRCQSGGLLEVRTHK